MADPATWIALVAAVAGAGYSSYQSGEAAKVSMQSGALNADLARQQALGEGAQMTAQANIGFAQAAAEKKAGLEQAGNLRAGAQQLALSSADEAARDRVNNQRLLAAQEAQTAASGLTAAGTPLSIMAETAGQQQLELVQNAHQRDQERRAMLYDAESASFGATQSQMGMMNQRAAAAAGGFRARRGAIEGGRIAADGAAAAYGYRAQAIGSAIGGISQAAGYYSNRRAPTTIK